MRRSTLTFFLMLFILAACSKGESTLSKALTAAVKERKLTQKKMEYILAEYDELRDDDKQKAREYFDQVLNAIEMGGDSTHIDVARKQVLRKQKTKKT